MCLSLSTLLRKILLVWEFREKKCIFNKKRTLERKHLHLERKFAKKGSLERNVLKKGNLERKKKKMCH
jgi:hypothetical protein